MGQIPFLDDFVIVAGLGALVTVLLSLLRLPPIAGLLFAGALVGPFGFALVEETHPIEVMAEMGVVLLLFSIGLEFSLTRLRHIFAQVALGGVFQVGGTIAVTIGIARFVGVDLQTSIFYGFVFALSSTAIMLRALKERDELNAPHGRFIVGTLIFQDLCVVPMVLILPALAQNPGMEGLGAEVGLALVRAAAVITITLVVARIVLPPMFRWIERSRSREVFLLAVLTICIGTAWITSLVGMSLALGAFLGGMVVADTDCQHRAMGDIIPFRDAFVSIFFVSLGMLFDVRFLVTHTYEVFVLLVGFTLGKAVLATGAAVIMRFPARAAWMAGVGLGQFGEFGFVMVKLAENEGMVDGDVTGPVLAAGVLSMFLTPVLTHIGPHITAGERVLQPLTRFLGVKGAEELNLEESLSGHVLVIGYGLAGRLMGTTLTECGIPFVALELNAETVRNARANGEPVYYADATSVEALENAHVRDAKAIAVLINDAGAVERVADTVRRVAPDVPLLIRTRYQAEQGILLAMGANEVISEEVEASVEMLARMLRSLGLPRNVIDGEIRLARERLSTSDREIELKEQSFADYDDLLDLRLDSVVLTSKTIALGKTLAELDLRKRTGALAISKRRGDQMIAPPEPHVALQEHDVVYLAGSSESLDRAVRLLTGCTRVDSHEWSDDGLQGVLPLSVEPPS